MIPTSDVGLVLSKDVEDCDDVPVDTPYVESISSSFVDISTSVPSLSGFLFSLALSFGALKCWRAVEKGFLRPFQTSSAIILFLFLLLLPVILRFRRLRFSGAPPTPTLLVPFRDLLSNYKPGLIYDFHLKNARLLAAYGPYKTWRIAAFKTKILTHMTASPDVVKHVLITNFDNWVKGDEIKSRFQDMLGDGIFNANGFLWKKQRKVASSEFSRGSLRDFMFDVFSKNAALAVSLIATRMTESPSGDVCEVEDVFARFTLDSIGSIGFGVSLGSLSVTAAGHYDHELFGEAFDTATALTSKRLLQPFWRLNRLFSFLPGDAKNMRDACLTIKRFTEAVISERRAAGDFETKSDLLSRFLRLSENDGGGSLEFKDGTVKFTDEELRHLVINFVLAGRDTTATLLTWSILELAKNPQVVSKIREEQKRLFNDAAPTFDSVSASMYLKAVVYEVLRLHPSVPTDFRSAVTTTYCLMART